MRFNPKARIDTSQVEDRSGSGGGLGGGLGGGGMRLPIPSGGGGRIGLGTVAIVIIYIVIQAIGGNNPVPGLGSGGDGSTTVVDNCKTGEDANRDQNCAIKLITNSIQNYWAQTLPQQQGTQYVDIRTITFSGATDSACGRATSAMGPFYCPNDQRVYLDRDFMDQMLTGELGAEGGPFALAYVLAHEYGHHIQDQLDILGQIRTQQGPASDSVKAELMADCLGGMWAKDAQRTTDALGQIIISDLSQDDIARAIDAAQAVGDDRIQKRGGGKVNPEQWTHGSSAERVHWFNTGLKEGSLEACNTFAPGAL